MGNKTKKLPLVSGGFKLFLHTVCSGKQQSCKQSGGSSLRLSREWNVRSPLFFVSDLASRRVREPMVIGFPFGKCERVSLIYSNNFCMQLN